jgi:hypothetical protein
MTPAFMNLVMRLSPEVALARAAKRFLAEPTTRCPKCRSAFVGLEPAFLHCRCCGAMARIAKASLADQELFELRSGLRLVS